MRMHPHDTHRPIVGGVELAAHPSEVLVQGDQDDQLGRCVCMCKPPRGGGTEIQAFGGITRLPDGVRVCNVGGCMLGKVLVQGDEDDHLRVCVSVGQWAWCQLRCNGIRWVGRRKRGLLHAKD